MQARILDVYFSNCPQLRTCLADVCEWPALWLGSLHWWKPVKSVIPGGELMCTCITFVDECTVDQYSSNSSSLACKCNGCWCVVLVKFLRQIWSMYCTHLGSTAKVSCVLSCVDCLKHVGSLLIINIAQYGTAFDSNRQCLCCLHGMINVLDAIMPSKNILTGHNNLLCVCHTSQVEIQWCRKFYSIVYTVMSRREGQRDRVGWGHIVCCLLMAAC